MDKQDIVLINEIVKLNVEKAVNKAVAPILEHLKNDGKKDLKEIKLLLAKVIKEGFVSAPAKKAKPNFLEQASIKQNLKKQAVVESYEDDYESIEEVDNDDVIVIKSKSGLREQVQDSRDVENAVLPNMDAPVFIDKNSDVYKSMMESLER